MGVSLAHSIASSSFCDVHRIYIYLISHHIHIIPSKNHHNDHQKAEEDEEKKKDEKSLDEVVAGRKKDSHADWLAAPTISGGSIARSSSVASGDGLEENAKSTGGLAAMVRFAAARITSCKYVVNS